jgi:NAD(P)H-dependent flavin oxidoreductase YrpB (nitropropane dioxygenase family)
MYARTSLTEIPDLITERVWPGALARAWRKTLIQRWTGREWQLQQQWPQVAAAVTAARAAGDAEHTPLLFGQDAGLIEAIEPAGEVIARLIRETHAVITGRLAALVAPPAPGAH